MEDFLGFLLFSAIIAGLSFIAFCLHIFAKHLQFVINAIDLYKAIIHREDTIIQLLVDIRDDARTRSGDYRSIKKPPTGVTLE